MGQWLKRWKDYSDNFEVSEEEVGVVQTTTQILGSNKSKRNEESDNSLKKKKIKTKVFGSLGLLSY